METTDHIVALRSAVIWTLRPLPSLRLTPQSVVVMVAVVLLVSESEQLVSAAVVEVFECLLVVQVQAEEGTCHC